MVALVALAEDPSSLPITRARQPQPPVTAASGTDISSDLCGHLHRLMHTHTHACAHAHTHTCTQVNINKKRVSEELLGR